MPDFIDGVPKSLRAIVFAVAVAGAIVTGAISTLSLIESKANAAAANAIAPLQVQINQATAKADQATTGQTLLWDKLGGKLDNLNEKLDTLASTVSGLAATQASQAQAVQVLAARNTKGH
jgi:hypothetical protein